MKSKLLILVAVLAIACWAPAAFATTIGFDLTVPNAALSTYNGPYVHIDITVPDGGGPATITETSLTNGGYTYFIGDGGALALNFSSSTSLTLVSVSNSNPDPWFTGISFTSGGANLNAGPGNVSEFGVFTNTSTAFDGFRRSFTYLQVTTTASFADASSVLTPNSDGFPAAAHVYAWDGVLRDASNNPSANVTGYASVPLPPSALLMGSGLLGLGLLGWRRKRKN